MCDYFIDGFYENHKSLIHKITQSQITHSQNYSIANYTFFMKLYYTTSEAAEILGIEDHTVRYYEKEFKLNFLRHGRDRKITMKDIEQLRSIIEEKVKGNLTLKGTHRRLNNKTDINKNKNTLKAKLLTIREFLVVLSSEL
jgi:excisionase family DNA binding protein